MRKASDNGELDPQAAERFERLREVRSALAKERQLPAYCICHDSVLRAIAENPPTDVRQLAAVKGLGPYKIEQYGEALLAAL